MSKITPGSQSLGALYGCIFGDAETVKFFINESKDTGHVKNVKLMWNDWVSDAGYGVHSDKKEAESFVKAFAKLYAPDLEKQLISTFFSNSSAVIDTGDYQIAYTYSKGPKIDERLIVVTPKSQVVATEKLRKASVSEFNSCKAVIAKNVGYSESFLSGDGEPVQNSGYKSFMVKGRGKDIFFCEIHSGNQYKVKAALNGSYPFKYIDQGKF